MSLTRKKLVEELNNIGYRASVNLNGQGISIRYLGEEIYLDDDVTEVPLEFIKFERAYPYLEDYVHTPIEDRGILHRGPTYRIKEFLADMNRYEVGVTQDDRGKILSLYNGEYLIAKVDPTETMSVTTFDMDSLPYIRKHEVTKALARIMMTPPHLRYWDFNEREKVWLGNYPQYQWISREDLTGGILLHLEYPRHLRPTQETLLVPYQEEMFLKVNQTKYPYKIK